MNFVCFNGNFISADEPVFTSTNRSFRYGDGVFETMKLYKEKILFEKNHFERLMLGLKMLQIKNKMDVIQLIHEILELSKKNNCSGLARVRLAAYRNHQSEADYFIEAVPLSYEVNQWNSEGVTIDIYPYARKSADAFANLKTANFLPYVLADIYSKQNGLDDAIVLNTLNALCDSSKANIFLIKNRKIYTPALHQGCINGIRRRFLIDELKREGDGIFQTEVSVEDLSSADEVFLTNSLFDLRSVKSFRDKEYSSEQTYLIYKQLIQPLY